MWWIFAQVENSLYIWCNTDVSQRSKSNSTSLRSCLVSSICTNAILSSEISSLKTYLSIWMVIFVLQISASQKSSKKMQSLTLSVAHLSISVQKCCNRWKDMIEGSISIASAFSCMRCLQDYRPFSTKITRRCLKTSCRKSRFLINLLWARTWRVLYRTCSKKTPSCVFNPLLK